VRAKGNSGLVSGRALDVNTNGTKVANDLRFLKIASAKHSQNTTVKGLLDCPTKREPQPTVARVTQSGCAQVWPWRLLTAFVVLVNQVADAVFWLWNFHDSTLLRVNELGRGKTLPFFITSFAKAAQPYHSLTLLRQVRVASIQQWL
jgi:hypothetical protein